MSFLDLGNFDDFVDFGAVCANSDKGPAPPPAARGRAPAALARGCRGGGGAFCSTSYEVIFCLCFFMFSAILGPFLKV